MPLFFVISNDMAFSTVSEKTSLDNRGMFSILKTVDGRELIYDGFSTLSTVSEKTNLGNRGMFWILKTVNGRGLIYDGFSALSRYLKKQASVTEVYSESKDG